MGLFRKRIDPAELERMQAEIASLREPLERQGSFTFALEGRLNGLPKAPPDDRQHIDALAEQLAALDARVTSVATELANQLTELGHDIDALGERPPAPGTDAAVVGELRDGQVRLATEQARYQIAFREDLARLAEQLKTPRLTRRVRARSGTSRGGMRQIGGSGSGSGSGSDSGSGSGSGGGGGGGISSHEIRHHQLPSGWAPGNGVRRVRRAAAAGIAGWCRARPPPGAPTAPVWPTQASWAPVSSAKPPGRSQRRLRSWPRRPAPTCRPVGPAPAHRRRSCTSSPWSCRRPA